MDKGQHFTNFLDHVNNVNECSQQAARALTAQGVRKEFRPGFSSRPDWVQLFLSLLTCDAAPGVASLLPLVPQLFEAQDYLLMLDLPTTHCLWERREGNVFLPYLLVYKLEL